MSDDVIFPVSKMRSSRNIGKIESLREVRAKLYELVNKEDYTISRKSFNAIIDWLEKREREIDGF